MPTFIKTGLWEKAAKGFKGWLNLDQLIEDTIPSSSLTADEVNAVSGANAPSATNVFATDNDIPAKRKYYTAYISQAGTTAPTVSSLLKDTIPTPVWSYSTVGTFLLTKTGAFTLNKTVPVGVVEAYDVAGNRFTLERTSADIMTLKTYAAVNTAVLANSVITNQYINIEIYL